MNGTNNGRVGLEVGRFSLLLNGPRWDQGSPAGETARGARREFVKVRHFSFNSLIT